MSMTVVALRAPDNTVTHTDRAPNLMNAAATTAAARNGKNIKTPLGYGRGNEKSATGITPRAL
jgi:hypothetical protein